MPPAHELDDLRLTALARRGDRAAFDTLFSRYAGRVLAFARQLTGNATDAEDLTSEVFVAAFRGLEGFNGRASLPTWLLSIAVRRHRDRSRSSGLPLSGEAHAGTCGASGFEADTLAALELEGALARLDLPLREAFLLVASQGLTYREAADALGCPVGTAKWRVSMAAKRLRELLTEARTEYEADEKKEVLDVLPTVHAG